MAGMTPETSADRTPADPPRSNDLDVVVRSIGDHALTVNLARAATLDDALAMAGGGRLEETGRVAAVESAHQLVGSAGTFGFPGASDLAAELEVFFAEAVFDERRLAQAHRQIAALLAVLATEPDYS